MSEEDRGGRSPAERAERVRRPYEPPAIADSAAFETLALACAVTASSIECQPPFGSPSRS